MKKIIFILFSILWVAVIADDYETKIKEARELTWNKKYEEAEKIYTEIIKTAENEELILDYANMLAWSGKTDKAIRLLESMKEKSNEVKKRIAKFAVWTKDYDKAYRFYLQIAGDEEGEKYKKWYKNYKKWKAGYSIASDTNGDSREEAVTAALTYDYYRKITIVLNHEWNYIEREGERRNRTQNNFGEIYLGNLYLMGGKSTITNYYFGAEYLFPYVLLGVKYADYKGERVKFYKVEKSFGIGMGEVTGNCIFVQNGRSFDKSFMIQGKYEIFKITDYFDLKKGNKGIINIKKEEIGGIVDIEGSLYRDFGKNINGIIVGTGIRF